MSDEPLAANTLLRVFKERVEQELFNDLMKSAEPRLRAAAKQAAQELEGEIKIWEQAQRTKLVIAVELKINGEPQNVQSTNRS